VKQFNLWKQLKRSKTMATYIHLRATVDGVLKDVLVHVDTYLESLPEIDAAGYFLSSATEVEIVSTFVEIENGDELPDIIG
jgi:hypothetical protein